MALQPTSSQWACGLVVIRPARLRLSRRTRSLLQCAELALQSLLIRRALMHRCPFATAPRVVQHQSDVVRQSPLRQGC